MYMMVRIAWAKASRTHLLFFIIIIINFFFIVGVLYIIDMKTNYRERGFAFCGKELLGFCCFCVSRENKEDRLLMCGPYR